MPHPLTALWSRYVTDPVLFCRTFWPDIKLANYQVEILRSVVENTETWVHSANQMGKSFTAALAALWWFATRRAKVVTSSTTEHQLATVLWSEIEGLLRTARLPGGGKPFPFVQSRLQILLPPEPGEAKSEKKYYLIGLVTQRVESFQGHHLKTLDDATGTVLFIFEEASGLEQEFYDAATSQAHRILAVGNPLRARGVFYEKCRAGDQRHSDGNRGLFRKVFHISGDDSPNVILGREWAAAGKPGPPPTPLPGVLSWDDYGNRRMNWRPREVRTRLLGLFDDEGEHLLFPYASLAAAQKLHTMYHARFAGRKPPHVPGGPFALGVDCAQGGDDCSAWVVFGRFGVVELLVESTRNTRRIVGNTLTLMRKYAIEGRAVAFDAAIGRSAADELREQGYEVLDVSFGARAVRHAEFHNRRAELYGELAEAVQAQVPYCGSMLQVDSADPAAAGAARSSTLHSQLSESSKERVEQPSPDSGNRIGRLLAGDEAAWKCYWRGPDAPDPFEHRPPSGAEVRLLEEQEQMERESWCVSIPAGVPELREDLAVLPAWRDGQGRLYLPPKDADDSRGEGGSGESVRKLLGGRSPDRGDALALAFYAWQCQRGWIRGRQLRRALVW